MTSPRSQAGLTLVEVLVAVVIMGIAFVAILGGMSTSILASDIHRKQSTGQTLLRGYAEAVKAQASWPACPVALSSFEPGAVGYTPPSQYSFSYVLRPTAVKYWHPSTGTFQSSCPSSDSGLILVSLEVVSDSGSAAARATERIDVVRRKP